MNTECTYYDLGKLRLTNGTNKYEGRVETCQLISQQQYVWWSVCSSQWDTREATVVCRQLGYMENYTQRGKSAGKVMKAKSG